jgi:hypothetical protein
MSPELLTMNTRFYERSTDAAPSCAVSPNLRTIACNCVHAAIRQPHHNIVRHVRIQSAFIIALAYVD